MWKFIAKRILVLIPVIFGATLLVYMILSMVEGDPARMLLGEEATAEQIHELREEMGLNDPLLVQYGRYMFNLFKGDMGISYKTEKPVTFEIGARLPHTIRLSLVAILVSVILAIPLGIIAAIKQNSIFDAVSMVFSILGAAMPVFWLSLLLILLFSLKLGWFPVFGADEPSSIVLPATALGLLSMASIARTTRSSMLEVIRQDYIRTARSKGLSEGVVIRKHALKNALIPMITIIGLQVGTLLAGSILTETVFAWPGIGRLMIQSILARDTPTVLGCIIVFSISFSIVNLFVDIIYGFVDPRMKSQYQ